MLRKFGLVLTFAVLLLVVAPALAGGWVVITLDSLPGEVRAGETLSVGFTVRQHGKTPINGVSPILSATNPATGETITVDATQSGDTGHFVAEIVFPSEGEWQWSVAAAPFAQEMQLAPLTVLPAVAAAGPSLAGAISLQGALRWTALALMAAGLLMAAIAMRRERTVAAPAAGD